MKLSEIAELLRSTAQNDYVIDGKYLDTGARLIEAAEEIEQLLEESGRQLVTWWVCNACDLRWSTEQLAATCCHRGAHPEADLAP